MSDGVPAITFDSRAAALTAYVCQSEPCRYTWSDLRWIDSRKLYDQPKCPACGTVQW